MTNFDVHGPVWAMLDAARNTTRFHMPGHKGLLSPLDMTELARTDDLYAPMSAIAEAERLAALSCGAARTLMLTGGSTAGLLAMLLTAVNPGETLILPRDAHHAAISACVWGGIDAVFTDDMDAAIGQYPKAKAILVTRPDYYGHCPDIAPLSAKAQARGILLLVDEAHGAHFPWWDAPKSAGAFGADAWVQSAHKTLPALTGAAWLHLSDRIDADRARRTLRMVQTSSPPFPILASLDDARAWMDRHGTSALARLVALLADFRARLAALPGLRDVPTDDPTRLVIDTRGRGLTGFEAQACMEARGVDVEMADDAFLVCICTVCDEKSSFDRLFAALDALPVHDPLPPVSLAAPPPGERAMSVRDAALAPQELVPLAKAEGRVAAIGAGLYPPGIPVLLPGETVTGRAVKNLLSYPPGRRFGVENECLICVK